MFHNNLICSRKKILVGKSVSGHHEWGTAMAKYGSRGKPGVSAHNTGVKIIHKE